MKFLLVTFLTSTEPAMCLFLIFVFYFFSTRSLSRASYTRLYNAGFTSLLDRNGDPPEVIDPEKEVKMLPLSKQIQDPLSCNEIVFQFLAFSKWVSIQNFKNILYWNTCIYERCNQGIKMVKMQNSFKNVDYMLRTIVEKKKNFYKKQKKNDDTELTQGQVLI